MTELRPSSSGQRPAARDPDAPELDRLRLWLEARYAETVGEIRGYPAPIPACDQHYNHLLARRRGYAEALRRLDQPPGSGVDPAAAVEGLIDFLRGAVSFTDSETRALSDHLKR